MVGTMRLDIVCWRGEKLDWPEKYKEIKKKLLKSLQDIDKY